MNLETNNIRIHVLTPVFIGSGEELSMLDFWIDESTCELVEFDKDSFLNTLSIHEIQKLGHLNYIDFMKLVYSKKPDGIRKKVSPDIVRTYRAVLNGTQREFNQFIIKELVKDIKTNSPYIPGSSLKGALRTGFLSSQERNFVSNIREKNRAKKLEQEILGSFSTDAFSTLKVGDLVPYTNVSSRICYIFRVKKTPTTRNNRGIPTMLEVIESGSSFEGSITLDKTRNTKCKISSIAQVLEMTERYSLSLLMDEKIGITNPLLADLQHVKQEFKNPTYLCRLGGYIGAESHTLESIRSIKIRNPRKGSDFRPYATCKTCLSNHRNKPTDLSCGWCLLEVIKDSTEDKFDKLAEFVAEQRKYFQDESPSSFNKFSVPLRDFYVMPKVSLDRNSTYKANKLLPRKERHKWK